MPDLDDLFEDIFDGFKKQFRKSKKKNKKHKTQEVTQVAVSLADRFLNGAERLRNEPLTDNQRPRMPADHTESMSTVYSPDLRNYLNQAQAYHQGITTLASNASFDFNRTRLEELTRFIDHWQKSLVALVQRVDDFQQNMLLQQDIEAVPKAIARLENQLAQASSIHIRQELERTLANRRQQLTALENLSDTMQWAELKIENTVSMLGTIYSQAHMSQSKGQVADYRRLLNDLEEEARSLEDYVTTLAEVKLGNLTTNPVRQAGA
ncbi:MAG: hypothetical protein AAF702_50120 [Chloroflexota bacterium]